MILLRPSFLLAGLVLLTGCSLADDAESSDKSNNPDYEMQPYQPPPARAALNIGELIMECERHLRAWEEAHREKDLVDRGDAVAVAERALGALVHREQARLEQQAMSGPPRNRGVASASLGFSGDPQTLPLIMNNVASEDQDIRANALIGVGMLAAEDTPLAPIQAAVQDASATKDVTQNAAFAAFRLANRLQKDPQGGLSAIFILLLNDPERTVRAQAASGLGLINATHAVPQLTRLLREDQDAMVRTAAAYALGEIAAPASMHVLVAALEDDDPLVAGTVRGSLVKIHGTDLGEDADEWERILSRY